MEEKTVHTYSLCYAVEFTVEADNGWEARERGWDYLKELVGSQVEFQLLDCDQN